MDVLIDKKIYLLNTVVVFLARNPPVSKFLIHLNVNNFCTLFYTRPIILFVQRSVS